ncbi:MAG TPA: DEAD/DEAH box helicase [Herbaspirillum sp.]|nr:DEAD/DEAH box helicase [Herbaspirillum sp.]
MALRDLGDWLLNVPGFRHQESKVVIDAACDELGSQFHRRKEHQGIQHDWDYLLFAASFLAQSNKGAAIALRVAQTCLCDKMATDVQRDSAALILDALANHPAIELAVKRSLLRPSFQTRLPGVARLDYSRRTYEQSISIHGDKPLRVNGFQKKLWEAARNHGWISVSAPTSAGKSFILARWICNVMRSFPVTTIVYLVPTRALISQVERDLRDLFSKEELDKVSVSALPIVKPEDGTDVIRQRVLVFTQERLHILFSAQPNLAVQALIVDEAHKVGDPQRGVLLQDVIERLSIANPNLSVLFASPMTSNPELLLADARPGTWTTSVTSEDVTVTQNLFWVSQRSQKPKVWDIKLCMHDESIELGEVELSSKPSSDSKRLSFIAHAIGGSSHGNVVYVNGAADAEKIAGQIFDLIGTDIEGESGKALHSLIELAQHGVHKEFALATCLRRGVAFHYGNMPLLVREEIEHLFSTGIIKYLVCTSTLIEGVNTACRNVFMRGPTKGRSRPLSAEDFWNLAGRAGRWGKEFQGNIFCIDPDRRNLWGEDGPPRKRTRHTIRRTTDDVLATSLDLIDYIRERAPLEKAKKHPEFEHVFSYLAGIHVRHGGVLEAPWAKRYGASSLKQLAEAVKQAVDELAVEPDTLAQNPGINPFALDDLLKDFRERQGDVEELLPVDPTSNDAAKVYADIFGRLCRRACPNLGPEGGRAFMLALVVTHWMRGFPLARLIEERLKYLRKKQKPTDIATEIRNVMNEVEKIARFEAPRGLSCYCDVLRQHLIEIKREDLIGQLPQINVFLELGVSQQTQISLIGIGLSRTSAIAVSDFITPDSLTEHQVLQWLVENEKIWQNFSLPILVKKEIGRVLGQHGEMKKRSSGQKV